MFLTRRSFLKWFGRLTTAGLVAGTYGVVIEPGFLLNTTVYAFTPPRWTPGLKLRAAIIADPHLSNPQIPLRRWRTIIETTNALKPDIVFLLGDYLASHPFQIGRVAIEDVASEALRLQSPLGTYSIMGNHDWWQDPAVQKSKSGPPHIQKVFQDRGLNVLDNSAVRLVRGGLPFWVSGTNSALAIRTRVRRQFEGRDDLAGALSHVTDDAPIIHLAHEPDLFVDVPERVSVTLSGHTHGGQVRLLGYTPISNSQFNNRFEYGHIIEGGRHLVVSGGLGCSSIPVRIGIPPEIVLLQLG